MKASSISMSGKRHTTKQRKSVVKNMLGRTLWRRESPVYKVSWRGSSRRESRRRELGRMDRCVQLFRHGITKGNTSYRTSQGLAAAHRKVRGGARLLCLRRMENDHSNIPRRAQNSQAPRLQTRRISPPQDGTRDSTMGSRNCSPPVTPQPQY